MRVNFTAKYAATSLYLRINRFETGANSPANTKISLFTSGIQSFSLMKDELFSASRREYCLRKINEEFQLVNNKPTIKHGGGSVTVWGCFSYHCTGNLVFINDIFTGDKYVNILENNLFISATKFGLQDQYVLRQDNDPKHRSSVAKSYF